MWERRKEKRKPAFIKHLLYDRYAFEKQGFLCPRYKEET
jgi:hypothetical protein